MLIFRRKRILSKCWNLSKKAPSLPGKICSDLLLEPPAIEVALKPAIKIDANAAEKTASGGKN